MVMDRILSVVLTSENVNACKRAVDSFPDHADVHVMCNSQNIKHFSDLRHSGIRAPIHYSESNGTPGCGKQSVYDLFLSTDYDYLIQIDGDDFLYPTGYELIENYILNNKPDVLGLLNEDIMVDQNMFTCWRDFDFDKVTGSFSLNNFQEMKSYFRDILSTIRQQNCIFNRIICVNKKAASMVKWDSQLPGTEDILISSQLKLMHLKDLVNYHIIESSDIYLYNKETNHGEGFKVLHSQPDFCRSIFFKEFTETDLKLLRTSELPHTILPEISSKFRRMKYVKKHLKTYS